MAITTPLSAPTHHGGYGHRNRRLGYITSRITPSAKLEFTLSMCTTLTDATFVPENRFSRNPAATLSNVVYLTRWFCDTDHMGIDGCLARPIRTGGGDVSVSADRLQRDRAIPAEQEPDLVRRVQGRRQFVSAGS